MIIKAKTNGSTLAVVKIKSQTEIIEKILNSENLINKAYLQDSYSEHDKEGNTAITMLMPDGDSPSAEFLKKKILSTICSSTQDGSNCGIMYSYEIEGDSHEKDPHC